MQLRNKAGAHNGATRNFGMPPATAVKQDAARFRAQEGQIIFPDADFFWLYDDTKKVLCAWNNGRKIKEIAVLVHRPWDEVLMQLAYLAKNDKLPARKGGLY